MVYDDDVFLDIFLKYWARFLPLKNIYVLIHAQYEKYEKIAAGCNCIRVNRPEMHKNSEVDRWDMISRLAGGMTFMFDKVIYTDVDEIVVVDPEVSDNPVDYMLGLHQPVVAIPGIDLVNIEALEPEPYDPARPVLSQRQHYVNNSWYTKPALISEPVRWCSGGHYCDRESYHIDRNLTLVHLRLFDARIFGARAAARIKMISDDSGQPIKGLGGKTWRRDASEYAKYKTEKIVQPETIFMYGHETKSHEIRRIRDDGMVLRSPMEKKQIRHLPSRYHGLF